MVATMTQRPGIIGELFDKRSDTIKSFLIGFAGGIGFFMALKIYNSISKKKDEQESEIVFGEWNDCYIQNAKCSN